MAKKTAIRRLFKYLPVGTELNRAVSIDEKTEAGINDNRQIAEAVLDGDFEILLSDFGGGDEPSWTRSRKPGEIEGTIYTKRTCAHSYTQAGGSNTTENYPSSTASNEDKREAVKDAG